MGDLSNFSFGEAHFRTPPPTPFLIIIAQSLIVTFVPFVERSLPSVVICHIAQYLSPRDLGNLSKVNHYISINYSVHHSSGKASKYLGIEIANYKLILKC